MENAKTVSGLPAPELVEALRELRTGDLVRLWDSVLEPWENLEVFPIEDMDGLFEGLGMPLNAIAEDLVRAHDAGRFDPRDAWVYLDRCDRLASFTMWDDPRSPVDPVRIALCASLDDLAEVGVAPVGVAPVGAWSR